MRHFLKRLLWHFDSSFCSKSVWKPVLWAIGFAIVTLLFWWLLELIWHLAPHGMPRICEASALNVDSVAFSLRDLLPYVIQLGVVLFCAIVLMAFLVAAFNRIITNRVAHYLSGHTRYYFNNHILILGGGGSIVPILNAVAVDQRYAGKDVVILSNQNAETLRAHIFPNLSSEAGHLAITIYFGIYGKESDLSSCQVENASYIFIVGEKEDKEQDALNVECWKRVRILRAKAPSMAQCYLYLYHYAISNLFHILPQESHTSLETTVINQYESVAQQLLVGDNPQSVPFTLDRGLITPNTDKSVHFVIVGMTRMGYALATTAAQLCHFSNFDEEASHPSRTTITFVDPSASMLMNHFKSNFDSLFSLLHRTLYMDGKNWMQARPDSRYGDFLDVKWEFLNGTVDDEWIRERLVGFANDSRQVLSVAFCGDSPSDNAAHAIHLPKQLYPPTDSEGISAPVIYVYQPESGSLMDAARNEIPKFRNVVAFGMPDNGFDPLQTHRIAAAKRINYLYQKISSGKEFTAIPTDVSILDQMWCQLSFAEKMSNIYAANSACVKIRNMGIPYHQSMLPISDIRQVELLVRTERARWNMEKLLAGFDAMTIAERAQLNSDLTSSDSSTRQEARMQSNRSKNQQFVLKDIAPYAEMTDAAKEYDHIIMRNLPMTLFPHIFSTSTLAKS